MGSSWYTYVENISFAECKHEDDDHPDVLFEVTLVGKDIAR